MGTEGSHSAARHRLYHEVQLRGPTPNHVLIRISPPAASSPAVNNALTSALDDVTDLTDRLVGSASWDRLSFLGPMIAMGPAGVAAAQQLIQAWIDRSGIYHPTVWSASNTAQRVYHLIEALPFLVEGQDAPWRERLFDTLSRQARHLRRVERRLTQDRTGNVLDCAAARTLACLSLPEDRTIGLPGDGLLGVATARLAGGVIPSAWSDPERALASLKMLEATIAAFAKRGLTGPDSITDAFRVARQFVSELMLKNGSTILVPFGHIMAPASPSVSSQDAATSVLHRVGLHRWTAEETDVLIDARPTGAAGSFTLVDNGIPIVTPCGAPSGLVSNLTSTFAHWRDALLTPASGTTLDTLDTDQVTAQQELGEEGHLIQIDRKKNELFHRRRLFLSADGTSLKGEDAAPRRPGIIGYRFHLHPDVDPTPGPDDGIIHLNVSKGRGQWAFRTHHARLAIEESAYAGDDGIVTPCQQIVLFPEREGVRWSIARA